MGDDKTLLGYILDQVSQIGIILSLQQENLKKLKSLPLEVNVSIGGEGKDIVGLLIGLSKFDVVKNVGQAGSLIKILAEGIDAFSKIDSNKIDNASVSMTKLSKVLTEFSKINRDTLIASLSLSLIIPQLVTLSTIKFNKLNEVLNNLDIKSAENLGKFILEIINPIKGYKADSLLRRVNSILSVVQSIEVLSNMNMKKLSNNLRNLDIEDAKSLTLFIEEILTRGPNLSNITKEQRQGIENYQEIIVALSKLNFDTINKSLGKLKKKNAEKLISFITAILDNDKLKKLEGNDALKSFSGFAQGLNIILNTDFKILRKNLKKLRPEDAAKIGNFIEAIIKNIPEDAEKQSLVILNVFRTLSNINISTVISVVLASEVLTPERGELLGKFIKALCQIDVKGELLKGLADVILSMNLSLLYITGSIVIISLMIKLDLAATLIGVGVIGLILVTLVSSFTYISREAGAIKESGTLMLLIGETLLLITASIGLLTGVFAIAGTMNAIMAVITVKIMLTSLVNSFKIIAESGDDIQNAQEVLLGISKALLIMTASIAILTLIPFPLAGIAVVELAVLTAAIIGITRLLSSKGINENIKNAQEALTKIGIAIGILTLDIVGLMLASNLVSYVNIEGLIVMGGIFTAIILGVSLLGLTIKQNGKEIALALVGISVLLTAVVFAANLLSEIGKMPLDLLAKGGAVVLVIMTALSILAVSLVLISKKLENNIKSIIPSLGIMILTFGIVTLITKEFIIPIGAQAGDAFLGIIAVLGILAGLAGIMALINMIASPKLGEHMKNNKLLNSVGISSVPTESVSLAIKMAVFTGMVVILGITSLITKNILIPIGNQAGKAFLGGITVLGILALLAVTMALINMIASPKLSKSMEKNKFFGAIGVSGSIDDSTSLAIKIAAFAGLAIILGIVALITKELLIPIGNYGKKAIEGGGIVLGVIFILGLIMSRLDKWIKKEKTLPTKIAMLGGMVLILAIISFISLELLIPIGLNAGDAALGGVITLGIIGILGGIIFAIAKFTNKETYTKILEAEGLILGLAIVIAAMSRAMMEVAKMVNIISSTDGWLSSLGIAGGVFLAVGGIITAISALLLTPIGGTVGAAIVIGEALFLSLSLVISAMSGAMILVSHMIKIVNDNIDENSVDVFKSAAMGAIESIGVLSLAMIPLSITAALAVPATLSIMPLLFAIGKYIDVVLKMANLKYVKEYDEKGKPVYETMTPDVFLTAANTLTNGFKYFIEQIGAAFKTIGTKTAFIMKFLAGTFRPLVSTLGKFVDIVSKVATLTMIVGYDKNGKPIYEKVDPDVFAEAATVVTIGFSEFITEIASAFKNMEGVSARAMIGISIAMMPLLLNLSMFVNIVSRVATMQIVTGYDERGKPMYEKVDPSVFGVAAAVVTGGFMTFIEAIKEGFGDMSRESRWAIQTMSRTIKPITEALSMFTDSIIKLATSTYVLEYDEKGNPKKVVKVNPEDYIMAAAVIVAGFSSFISSLITNTEGMSENAQEAIKILSKTLKPIMESVALFTDSIIKASISTYVVGYDEKGKAIYKKISLEDFSKAAGTITTNFKEFISGLSSEMNKMSESSMDAIKALSKNIKPIMEAVSKFVDSIVKAADATYIDHYDEKGKPVYIKIDDTMFASAAGTITTLFGTFIEKLTSNMNGMSKDAQKSIKALSGTIKPIMDAVSKFVDAVIKVAAGSYIESYDKNGKPKYGKISLKDMEDAATKTTGMFSEFIKQLSVSAGSLSKDATNAIKELGKGIKPIMDGISSFVDAIIKVASALIVTGYDEKGNPIYGPITATDKNGKPIQGWEALVVAGDNVTLMFSNFLLTISDNFGGKNPGIFSKTALKRALDSIKDSIDPVMNGIGVFIDAIIKVATARMIKEYDKNGNPVYETIKTKTVKIDKDGHLLLGGPVEGFAAIAEAGKAITLMFMAFVISILKKFTDKTFRRNVKNALDAMKESINPVMDSVGKFSDTIIKFASDLTLMNNMLLAGTNLSSAYNNFFSAIVGLFSQEKFNEDLKKTHDVMDITTELLTSVLNSAKRIMKIGQSLVDNADILAKITEKYGPLYNVGLSLIKISSYSTLIYEKLDGNGKRYLRELAILPLIVRIYMRATKALFKLVLDEGFTLISRETGEKRIDALAVLIGKVIGIAKSIKKYRKDLKLVYATNFISYLMSYLVMTNILVGILNTIRQNPGIKEDLQYLKECIAILTSKDTISMNVVATMQMYSISLATFAKTLKTKAVPLIKDLTNKIFNLYRWIQLTDDILKTRQQERIKIIDEISTHIETLGEKLLKVADILKDIASQANLQAMSSYIKTLQAIQDINFERVDARHAEIALRAQELSPIAQQSGQPILQAQSYQSQKPQTTNAGLSESLLNSIRYAVAQGIREGFARITKMDIYMSNKDIVTAGLKF